MKYGEEERSADAKHELVQCLTKGPSKGCEGLRAQKNSVK